MNNMFIDSHTHMHNYEDVLEKYQDAFNNHGLFAALNIFEIGKDENILSNIHILKNLNKNILSAAAVHPAHIDRISLSNAYNVLMTLLPYISCIGETGLDTENNLETQLDFLNMHYNIAKEHNLPMSIHCRYANIKYVTDLLLNIRYVFHCFTSSLSDAQYIIENTSAYISFSGIVTFKNAKDLIDVILYCPLDRMLIETDSPCLSPEPLRGKKNTSSNIRYIYEFISQKRNISIEFLSEQMKKNWLPFIKVV